MENLPHPKILKALEELKESGVLSEENRPKILKALKKRLAELEAETGKDILKK